MSAASSAAPDCAGRNGAHTPGPWHVARVRDEYAVIEDASGEVVADVYGADRRALALSIVACQSLVHDLLAIAKEAKKCAAYWNGEEQPSFVRIEAMALAAIAKADGRS